jgi:hypothetical protein
MINNTWDSWSTNIYNTIAREAALRKDLRNTDKTISTDQQNISFYQYQNSNLGFSIQYPSNWEKFDDTNGVDFLSPLENNQDRYREGVSVKSFKHLGYSREQYVEALVNDLRQKTQLYGTYANHSKLAEHPAIEYHCMFYSNNISCEMKTLFSIINNKLYLVEYYAYDYARFLQIADRIITTFQIYP